MLDFTFMSQSERKSADRPVRGGRGGSPPFRHILVAIDGSEQSAWAAEAAGRLARALGARLTLVHVAGVPMILAGEIGYVPFPPTGDTRDDGEQMLAAAAAKLPAGVEVEQLMHEGDPKRQIVAAARDVGADLIMMGRHAKGPLARMVLGSVAEYVVRHAHCPVLTMAHPAEAEVLEEPATLEVTPAGVEPSVHAPAQKTGADDVAVRRPVSPRGAGVR